MLGFQKILEINVRKKAAKQFMRNEDYAEAIKEIGIVFTLTKADKEANEIIRAAKRAFIQSKMAEGKINLENGFLKLAEKCYQQIIELEKDHPEANRQLDITQKRCQIETMPKELEKKLVRIALNCCEKGSIVEAIEKLQSIIDPEKKTVELLAQIQSRLEKATEFFDQAKNELERGDIKKAEKNLRQGESLFPQSPEIIRIKEALQNI